MNDFQKIMNREKEIQDVMRNPKLMKFIIEEVHKEGVVGEENSIMALILKISLRLVKMPLLQVATFLYLILAEGERTI